MNLVLGNAASCWVHQRCTSI